MPKLTRIFIILPCHSLEDFPTHHRGDEASNLLANWTAAWHPALIAAAEAKPDWHRADVQEFRFDLEKDCCCLGLLPKISESSLDLELLKTFENHDSIVIKEESDREVIATLAMDAIPAAKELAANLDPEIVKDFYALGYAFLQTQIMTRQLRYSSNLDEEGFTKVVVETALAATSGDNEKAKAGINRSFDLLLEEKNGYYPVDPDLIDVVLTAPTTIGKSLQRQLNAEHTQNILITGSLARKLSVDNPDAFAKLKSLVEHDKVAIVGGLENELESNHLSSESNLNQLQRGQASLKQLFGTEASVFMRRKFGLNASLPRMLDQLDFVGVVHATLDDGSFPRGSSCNIRWTGDDESSVLAFGDLPLSASDAGSFLGLGVTIGEAIDSAHVSAVMFVHWPGDTCQAFEDLVRITNYGPLFGDFLSINDYFESVYDPGYGETFTADEYRTPFLSQAVAKQTPNPVSRMTTYWERFYKLSACRSLLTQACAKVGLSAEASTGFQNRLLELQTDIEAALNIDQPNDDIDSRLELLQAELNAAWAGTNKASANKTPGSDSNSQARTVINTTSLKQRVEIKTQKQKNGTLKHELPVVYADGVKDNGHWVLELPAMGAAQIGFESLDSKDSFRADPLPNDGMLLRNEFFQLEIDETTGGIRGIQIYGQRGNLGGQQIAMRIPGQKDSREQPLTRARYTTMVCDHVETTLESRLAAEITTQGRLMDGDDVAAQFTQSVRVCRGKRIAEITIQLNEVQTMTQSQNHYVCSRLAWKDESSRLIANDQESKYDVTSDWFHGTNFVEVVQDTNRITLLTGGIPYHRRANRRMLDTILVVGNETQRKFQFGLGVNVPYAFSAAVARMTPLIEVESPAGNAIQNSSSWLFHFNCKNIIATYWAPIHDNDDESEGWTGVEIRLRETEGRSGKLTMTCPRAIASVERTNFKGTFLQAIDVSGEDLSKLELDFGRFEYFQIKIHWKA